MNFYCGHYIKQIYNNIFKCWEDISFTSQEIIVIADSYEEAEEKITKCLSNLNRKDEYGKHRCILIGNIDKCIGLDMNASGVFSILDIALTEKENRKNVGRLTERDQYGTIVRLKAGESGDPCEYCYNAIQKLAKFEDLEEKLNSKIFSSEERDILLDRLSKLP